MWYYASNDLTHGPVSERELQALLRRKAITPQTLVWCEGTLVRQPLEQTELAAKFEIPLPEGEQWRTCTFSGAMVRESEMCQVDGFFVAKACRDDAQAFVDAGGWLPNLIRSRHFPTLWQRLRRFFRHLRDSFVHVLLPACALYLLINIPLQLGLARINQSFVGQTRFVLDAVFSLELLLQVGVLSLPLASILFLFKEEARGRHPGIAKALATGFAFWGRMAVTNLVLTVVIGAWSMIQWVPDLQVLSRASMSLLALLISMYVWLRLAYASVIIMDPKMTPGAALKLSWNMRGAREMLPPGRYLSPVRLGLNMSLGTDLPLMFFVAMILKHSGLLLSAPPAILGLHTSTLAFCLRGLLNLSYMSLLFQFYTERNKQSIAKQLTRLAA